jgi:hypothetical protein
MPTITDAICTSFKDEVLGGTHDLDTSGDTLKIALIKEETSLTTDSFGASTTSYSSLTANSNEVSGTGYTTGGAALSSQVVENSGTVAFLDFADVSWSITGTLTAGGALIYNSSKSNKAIAVIDFGGAKTANDQTFAIQFPAADSGNAIIRVN